MRRFLLGVSFLFLLLAGCETEENEERGGSGRITNVDLFHGYYDVGPGYHFRLKFSARTGDTLFFEARARDGDGDISFAFWSDSINYARWLADDSSAVLNGYRESVPRVSYTVALDSSTYYVVLGNSSTITTKRFWIRAYLRGVR